MNLMLVLMGFFSGLLVSTVIAFKYRNISGPIFCSFFLRTFFLLAHEFKIIKLPGGNSDAVRFERTSKDWSELPWPELLEVLDMGSSYVYSWLGAVLYKITAPNSIWLVSFNINLGIIAVFLTYLIAINFTSKRRACFIAWIAALFPTAIIHSSVALREMMIIVPFSFGCLMLIYWVSCKKNIYIVLSVLSFSIASIFHGGIIAAIFGTLIVVVRETFSPLSGKCNNPKTTMLSGFIGIALVLSIIMYAMSGNVKLSSIGHVDDRMTGAGAAIEEQFIREAKGGSAYPSALATSNPWASPWVIPARLFYFIFSPFPWDIKSTNHIQGVIPAAVYMWAFLSIIKSIKFIDKKREYQAVLIILGLITFVYSMGVTNVGTSIRHRTKMFHVMVALCAVPVLNKFNLIVKSRHEK